MTSLQTKSDLPTALRTPIRSFAARREAPRHGEDFVSGRAVWRALKPAWKATSFRGAKGDEGFHAGHVSPRTGESYRNSLSATRPRPARKPEPHHMAVYFNRRLCFVKWRGWNFLPRVGSTLRRMQSRRREPRLTRSQRQRRAGRRARASKRPARIARAQARVESASLACAPGYCFATARHPELKSA